MRNPCQTCNAWPKLQGKHRCEFCIERANGTDAEVRAALARQKQPIDPPDTPPTAINPVTQLPYDTGFCADCHTYIPTHYMKTKSRCRGCELARVRSRDDSKKYGLAPGERAEWAERQQNRCFGCGNQQRVTGLAVHHNHLTGEPYFLACMTCNSAVMGSAFDSPDTLLRLALGMIFPPHQPGSIDKIHAVLSEVRNQRKEEQ